jgi:hypothetical protein
MLFALHSDFAKGTTSITSDDMLIVLDSGCTCAITFDKSDFVGPIRPVQDVELKGISSGLQVAGIGQVIWTFLNEHNHCVQIPLTCLYVPDATTRLLPPQQLSKHADDSSSTMTMPNCNTTAYEPFNTQHRVTFEDDESNITEVFDAFNLNGK